MYLTIANHIFVKKLHSLLLDSQMWPAGDTV